MTASYVYFLRPIGADGPVKIGCSARPRDRLSIYMSWSPVALEIVASLPGDQLLEQRLHAHFVEQHLHGEWFRASPALTLTIEHVAAGTFDAGSLAMGKRLPIRRRYDERYRHDLSLVIRYGNRAHNIGLRAYPKFSDAAEGLRKAVGADYDAKVALLIEYLADPFGNSKQGDSPFQRGRFADFLRRHPEWMEAAEMQRRTHERAAA